MKVKVGLGNSSFYVLEVDSNEVPVMIILSQEDKKLIANMAPEATKFLSYPDWMDTEQTRVFMKDKEAE